MKALKIITALIFIIAIAITAVAVNMVRSNPFTNSDLSQSTTARIIENEKDGYSNMSVSINNDINLEQPGHSKLSFVTEEGEEVVADFPWYFAEMPEDDTAYIVYLKDDPSQITLDSFFFHSFGVIMLGIGAFILYSFGAVMLLLTVLVGMSQKKEIIKNTENNNG